MKYKVISIEHNIQLGRSFVTFCRADGSNHTYNLPMKPLSRTLDFIHVLNELKNQGILDYSLDYRIVSGDVFTIIY